MKISNVYLSIYKCYFVIFIIFSFISSITSTKWAKQLKFDLLKDYDSMIEPVPQNQTFLTINLGISVFSIAVDYEASTVYLSSWVSMRWIDHRLMWNASKYDGLKGLRFRFSDVWTPQIVTMNRAEPNKIDDYSDSYHVLAQSTGYTMFVPLTSFTIYCNLNLENWPFDEHTCELILRATGTYKSALVFNQTLDVSLEDSESNWNLVDSTTQHVTKNCYLCQATLSEMHYEFTVKRHEKPYYGFVLLPAIGLCFLLLSSFWLPLMTTKKFALITVLLITSTMFYIFLSRRVPIFSHQVPKIILLYMYITLLSIIYLVVSLILYNAANSKDLHLKPLPQQVRSFFNHPLLHFLKITLSEECNIHHLNEFDSSIGSSEYHSPPSMSIEWFDIATIINRIIFIFYFFIILIMLFRYLI